MKMRDEYSWNHEIRKRITICTICPMLIGKIQTKINSYVFIKNLLKLLIMEVRKLSR